ncbi:AAA family ATPase [Candidatus Marsarchaeota archaeon]|nr:AAA family ATPase [Candidatus Marsarchaeota archaeon]MCL5404741.1 AAA family ATPase [Candidatus Marsarchaeota archaeon]
MATTKDARSARVQQIIKQTHRVPIWVYRLKDIVLRITENNNFVDALLIAAAFLLIAYVFPFYPYLLALLVLVFLFASTEYHPFLGFIFFMLAILPIFIYQTPALAWIFLFILSFSLVYGYMHYRTIIFTYILIAASLSLLGFIVAIPAAIFAILTVGFKRASIMFILVILGVAAFSGTTGLNAVGITSYNGAAHYAKISAGNANLLTNLKLGQLSLVNFVPAFSKSINLFLSSAAMGSIDNTFVILVGAITSELSYLIALPIAILAAFVIEYLAINSRSKYKGSKASLAGIIFPVGYEIVAYFQGSGISPFPFIGFAIAPLLLVVMELYNVHVVKALDVKKQDTRMKFGEAFEDLQQGNVHETFDDIGNYENTKEELKEAVIGPLEKHGISRAYNIKPLKGLLFFGPPGTGKTMMMRALANEIHANFFYVKATNLISAYTGESEKLVSNIFATAKKNTPCILFIDEIDSIAQSREGEIDETHRHALSQLLVELDGFQRLDNVIVVGATNAPDKLDPAILRPGRMDRAIYMQLPDFNGRKKIFEIYLKGLPLASDLDLDKIAESTPRYSGADIKAVCESVAQIVAQEAANEHKILEITMDDILSVIRATKPSTSLAQIEKYNRFKIDFERRMGNETNAKNDSDEVTMDKVIGLDSAKKAIVEAIQLPLMHPDLLDKYDIKTINGMLLFGPPGTGKTMLMRAVANELNGVTMLEIDAPALQEEGVENANKKIKEIFYRAMENKPAIIFIDEIDGLVVNRQGASELSAQITTEVLKDMDSLKKMNDVIVVGATNRPDVLDPAILRPGRFDKLVFVKPPDADSRAKIFDEYLEKAPKENDIDTKKLADMTPNFTGADIANVCREAKTMALHRAIKSGSESKISMSDLQTVIGNMKPSAPDIVMSRYLAFYSKYGQR